MYWKRSMRCVFLFVAFLHLGLSCFAQDTQGPASIQASDFVIDKSKPYVYLVVDHIGPRKPIRADDGDQGVWLRIVNNCRLPIVFYTYSSDGNAISLVDSIVEEEPLFEISGISNDIPLESPVLSVDVEGRPTPAALPGKPAQGKQSVLPKRPSHYATELPGTLRIPPGAQSLINMPRSHIDRRWYMQLKFTFVLDHNSMSVGPFSVLDCHQWDIDPFLSKTNLPAH